MAPQKFADLGKEARDLESKNFHFGVIKVEAKTKAKNGTDLTVDGTHNTDTGNVVAALETKFKYAPYGISFTKKWNTNNLLTSTIGVEDKLVKGLKIDLDTSLAPAAGKVRAKVKTAYKYLDHLHATADVDFADFSGTTLNGSAVLAHNGWHLGAQASYDAANSKLLDHNACLSYKKDDIVLHGGIVNASKYIVSVHHQVNKDLAAAALVNYSSSSGSSLTVCGQYAVDANMSLKGKLDNNLHLGCSMVHTLRPSLQLTLSGLLNLKSIEQGGHKLGLSLNYA